MGTVVMRFWWVYQGTTYERAWDGGYLWAPNRTKAGRNPYYYWTNVREVLPGDLIFSHVRGSIAAIGEAVSHPYNAAPPDPRDLSAWPEPGWRVDVRFAKLNHPISYEQVHDELLPLVDANASPFAGNGRPNQGYLFSLPEAAGVRLLELITDQRQGSILDAFSLPPALPIAPGSTSTLAEVAVRVGQALFRKRLDRVWNDECAVSGVRTRELLRASHIIPWGRSNDHQRLDPFNGLLLTASYDAAFDNGLISFNDDGSMIYSPMLSMEEAARSGLAVGSKLRFTRTEHSPYLTYHREHILRPLR